MLQKSEEKQHWTYGPVGLYAYFYYIYAIDEQSDSAMYADFATLHYRPMIWEKFQSPTADNQQTTEF